MVDLIGNLVFIGGKLFILLFLLYVWVWLFLNGEYLIFFLLTIFMAAGGYMGYREAVAEGA
jgi:hypothetical protein